MEKINLEDSSKKKMIMIRMSSWKKQISRAIRSGKIKKEKTSMISLISFKEKMRLVWRNRRKKCQKRKKEGKKEAKRGVRKVVSPLVGQKH